MSKTDPLKQIRDELRAAYNWKMAGNRKAADDYLKSAFAGLKKLAFGPRVST